VIENPSATSPTVGLAWASATVIEEAHQDGGKGGRPNRIKARPRRDAETGSLDEPPGDIDGGTL